MRIRSVAARGLINSKFDKAFLDNLARPEEAHPHLHLEFMRQAPGASRW
jgi:hypothetical protein